MSILRRLRNGLIFLALALFPANLEAQQDSQVTFGGQVRPRFEGRTPVDGEWNNFTSMRTRAALNALLRGNVRIFVQVQDVRFFGEETNTLSDYDANNFDLHQGYVEFSLFPSEGGTLRVGRQEMAFAEQRLVGSVNWTQQGRSFDGIRYTTPSLEGVKLDLFGMKLRDETAGTHEYESSFLGVYGNAPTGDVGSLDVYGLFVTDSREDSGTELTFGARWNGQAGPVDLRFEGSLQTGKRDEMDVSAYMLGARAGGKVHESITVTGWYDRLSGDDDLTDDETGVFNTLFATNHAFYGFYDLFLNIPAHTGGLGLQDVALKFNFILSPEATLGADLHHFRTAAEGDLSTGSLANELDLTLNYRILDGVGMTGGYSYVQAQDGIKELERLSKNGQWVFLMLNATF